MKRVAAWLGAALIGAAIGAFVMGVLYGRTIRFIVPPKLQSMEDEQRYRCILSMAVLDRLEMNEPDRAKLLLTREIASYYHHSLGVPESQQRKKTLEHIETLRSKSKDLNEELSKNSQ
jgi:predicted glycosyltransferase